MLGAEFLDIRQYASEQKWDVSDRQLWRYIAAGDKILEQTLDRDRARIINRHVAQRRALFARAMSVSDYGVAARVLKDEADLLGLYPPKRSEVTGADGGPVVVEMTDADRAAAIAAILARVGAAGAGPDHPGEGHAA